MTLNVALLLNFKTLLKIHNEEVQEYNAAAAGVVAADVVATSRLAGW